MAEPNPKPIEVIQADRDAAAEIMRALKEIRPADFAENGFSDDCQLVQAFARHRLDHTVSITPSRASQLRR